MLKQNLKKTISKIVFTFNKNLKVLLLLTLPFIIQFSCNPAEPPDSTGQDTTSHNFTWQNFTFGGAATSSLFDVAIIDENNIWAVGEIYMNDSLGNPDPIVYNAVHWDGTNWNPLKISVSYNGNETISPLKGILVLHTGEIILSSGLPYLPQGNSWKLYHLWDMGVLHQNDGGVDHIWGSSMHDLFFVGYKGSIVHFDGTNWQKIESGTTLNINDVWGNVENNITTVLAAASNLGTTDEKKLLRIQGTKIDTIDWTPQRTLYTVWFNSLNTIYAGGDGLYFKTQNGWETNNALQAYFSFRVRGTANNNVIAAGGFGFAAHFNGANWKVLDDVALVSGNYYGLDVKGKITALVGSNGSSAIITIGKQQ
ncbi:MAG: glucosyl transferase [Ignavibacteriota bacterium]